MKVKLATVSLAVLCGIACMNFACTPSQEKKAAQLADTYAHSVSAIHSAIDVVYAQNLMSAADYQAILKDLHAADQGTIDLDNAIRGVAAGTTTTAQVQAVVQGIETALADGTAHIKDPATLQDVKTIVAAINVTLTSVESIYQIGANNASN